MPPRLLRTPMPNAPLPGLVSAAMARSPLRSEVDTLPSTSLDGGTPTVSVITENLSLTVATTMALEQSTQPPSLLHEREFKREQETATRFQQQAELYNHLFDAFYRREKPERQLQRRGKGR
ncbi:MAG: hypothetical protein BJ554DRAFT_7537 [Olpidium bornovanus]|uniref:Uncharacterized protein n=1 Tax=Olpidium bornovanus TaxID=278681 RepID=A0A8H8DJS5_9FUNG|nr:MAG: hypothetical protein BJ554DRAFT_7537 [Olpidium bornovanus]